MTRIRGIAVLGTIQFVREAYGAEAHERVLAVLPAEARAALAGPVREASWKPLHDLAAYVEAARLLLAPDEADFYRRLGRFVGRVEREKGGFKPMMAEPSVAMRLAPMAWSALYDSGRVEFEASGPREGRARVYDFRTSRALCEANRGAFEGLAGTDELPARVEETACVTTGSPYCEFLVVWGSPPGAEP